jgi:hypothetical protein
LTIVAHPELCAQLLSLLLVALLHTALLQSARYECDGASAACSTLPLCVLPVLVAVRVDDHLGRWAQELINLQEEDCCLHQPACQPVDLPPQLRHSLYIRHSYRKLFELVWDKCKGGKAGEQLGFIVTGTPGIGKSAFALYLVQQLGMRRQIVCYEYQDEHRSRQRIKLDFRDIDSVVAKRIQLPASDGEHTWLHIRRGTVVVLLSAV